MVQLRYGDVVMELKIPVDYANVPGTNVCNYLIHSGLSDDSTYYDS